MSPIPKHIRTPEEESSIDHEMVNHIVDIEPNHVTVESAFPEVGHRAKYRPGQATALLRYAVGSVGDPFAGTGQIAMETGTAMCLNDIDPKMFPRLQAITAKYGGKATCVPADKVPWKTDTVVFSPPYYPKADRKKPAAIAGDPVGFRDSYDVAPMDSFIGNPSGKDAILHYRNQMRDVFKHLLFARRMVTVTKNWTRLGVELRLDRDMILTAKECGWTLVERHGWTCKPSLWSRFNASRGTGVAIEDVLVFENALIIADGRGLHAVPWVEVTDRVMVQRLRQQKLF